MKAAKPKCKVAEDCSKTLLEASEAAQKLDEQLGDLLSKNLISILTTVATQNSGKFPEPESEYEKRLYDSAYEYIRTSGANSGTLLANAEGGNYTFNFDEPDGSFAKVTKNIIGLRDLYGKKSNENISSVTVKQRIADAASFFKKIKDDFPSTEERISPILDVYRQLDTIYKSPELEKCSDDLYQIFNVDAATRIAEDLTDVLGQVVTRRGEFSDLSDEEAGRLGQSKAEENKDLLADIGAAFGFADKAIYREQCFLLTQVPTLLQLKNKMPPRLPYNKEDAINKNAPLMVFDEPFGFINRMTQAPHSHKLFNLTTAQISSLVPTIKLYKVLTSPATGKDLGYVEIKFDSNPSIKSYTGEQSALDLFKSKNKRGLGVGLKDFNFTFHGSDPFAAKKAIQAKVSIFATSFGDLIQERDGEVYPTTAKIEDNVDTNYKFADLALKTGKTPEDLRSNLSSIQKENLDKLNFRLKVVLGWAIPHKYLSSFTEEDRAAVNDSFVNLSLTPTTHEFSFDEMGGVTFDINYLAYIEDYFNNSMFNIFSSPGVEANRIGRRLMYDYLENNNCEKNDITKIKEIDAQSIQLEKVQSFRKILSDFTKEKRIFYYNLSYAQISQFIRTGKVPPGTDLTPKLDGKTNVKEIDKQFTTIAKSLRRSDSFENENMEKIIESIKVSLYSTSSETNKVSFFFISDLLDIIMKNIDNTLEQLCDESGDENKKIFNYANQIGDLIPKMKSDFAKYTTEIKTNKVIIKEIEKLKKAKEQFKKMRIVLGPIEIRDQFNPNNSFPCTIGDIPISLNYFLDFLTEKKLSKDEVVYPISNFVKDLVNDLIKNFLNTDSCFSHNTKQRIRLNNSTISCFSRSKNATGNDDITYLIKKYPNTVGRGNIFQGFHLKKGKISIDEEVPPVLLVSGPSRHPLQIMQASREFNYQVFYAGRAYPAEKMTGNEQEDLENGIFHYLLGKDRGLVKNISLERTDMTGLKELRFEQEGFDGLTQLREVYNANIDSMLNLHTFPGTYIFVDPRGFSPEAGIDYTQFGIGGYYMITRSEHSIGPGKADTKIVAKWVAHASKEKEAESKEKERIVSENESTPTKCHCRKKRRVHSGTRFWCFFGN